MSPATPPVGPIFALDIGTRNVIGIIAQPEGDRLVIQAIALQEHEERAMRDGQIHDIPKVVRAVKVPVVAAGGIADAQGVAAAMALGAAGVQIGTAFLLCPEASTTAVHRAALKSDAARHTALTNVFTGRPARGIVNRVMRELGPISAAAPAFPLATSAIAPLRAKAEAAGSGDFSPLWSGQNATGCRELPAAELTRMLAGR